MGLKILSATAVNNASGGVKELLIQFVNDESSVMNYLSGTVKVGAEFLDKSDADKIAEILRLIKSELYPEPFNEDLILDVKSKLLENTKELTEIKKQTDESAVLSEITIKNIIEQIKQVTKTVLKSDISDEDYQSIIASYPDWEQDKDYVLGEVVKFNSKIYEVITAHTSQADWSPDIVPALFKVITPKTATTDGAVVNIVPNFTQPTGLHDAYAKGDKVHFEGVTYVSIIEANVYSPKDYSAGWEVDTIEKEGA